MKRIAKFALFGAVGFGVGGLVLGTVGFLEFKFRFPYLVRWTIELLGYVSKGLFGGMALGLALRRNKNALALFGSGGFLASGLLAIYWEPSQGIGITDYSGITVLGGALGGGVLGLALKQQYQRTAFIHTLALSSMRIFVLAIASSLGIITGMLIASYVLYMNSGVIPVSQLDLVLSLKDAAALILEGVGGGAVLGVAVAYLEKE